MATWKDAILDRWGRARAWFETLDGAQKALVIVAAVVIGFTVVLPTFGLVLGLLLLGLLAVLVWTWFEELVWLMRQPDEVFPGRFDKLIWAVVLIFLPPLGVPALWAFRQQMTDTQTAKPRMPGQDWF